MTSTRRFIACLLTLALIVGCGDENVVGPTPQPRYDALSLTLSPVWIAGGNQIGFRHQGIASVTVDPEYGDPEYFFSDSLVGWWSVQANGSAPARRLEFPLQDAALSHSGSSIAFTRFGNLWRIELTGGIPDSTSRMLIPTATAAALPRWAADDDSIVYSVPLEFKAGIVATDGTGSRIACDLIHAGWNNTGDSLIGIQHGPSVTGPASYLVRFDLMTGAYDTLLASAPKAAFRVPRLSPDGTRLAFTLYNFESGEFTLWAGNADGTDAHQITSDYTLDRYDWHPNSSEIAYIRYELKNFGIDNGSLYVVNVDTRARRKVFPLP